MFTLQTAIDTDLTHVFRARHGRSTRKPRRGLGSRGAVAAAFSAALRSQRPPRPTTFCVPSFHAACPDGGGNVAQTSLQTALNTNSDDGQPDRIIIAARAPARTPTPTTLGSGDNDDLEIVGAGPGVELHHHERHRQRVHDEPERRPRNVTMRDLTLVVPASFDNNAGRRASGGEGHLRQRRHREPQRQRRRVVSFDRRRHLPRRACLRLDGRRRGGQIDIGVKTNGAETGGLEMMRSSIENPSWGVHVDDAEVVTFVRRTRIMDPLAYGVRVTDGRASRTSTTA